jgi:uncharacterized SAM-binding protein YcdF (DUF218 family)
VKRAPRILALSLAAVIVLALIFHNAVLTALGSYLVNATGPEKADIGLVLGGDYMGNRILTAAQLVRRGYVPKVLISGPGEFYGHHECDLAIPFAVKAGYPESSFVHFENTARSTKDEAQAAVALLRQLGVHKVLLVTSDYHTRRAGRIFRAAGPDLQFVVVAAPDRSFTADGWWHSREGQKVAFLEWSKTISERFGI